jgi:hypothetical protein
VTQISEGVLIGMWKAAIDTDETCVAKPPPTWQARINDVGSLKDCDADRLYKSMANPPKELDFRRGKQPYVKKAGAVLKLRSCGPTKFPLQAHHLIPKNFLPKHSVCSFLAKGYTKNPDYKLKVDAPYDNDHAANGYCLPYASALAEWKGIQGKVKKDKLAQQLMKLTQRQLHQGSHKEYQYEIEPAAGTEEDDDEVGHQHGPGYLGKARQLLGVVTVSAMKHTNGCDVCKPDKSDPETFPRATVVRHMHQASGLLKTLMDANRIFVSQRAFTCFESLATDPELPDWLDAV